MIAHRKMNIQTGEESDVQPGEPTDDPGYLYFYDEISEFSQADWDELRASLERISQLIEQNKPYERFSRMFWQAGLGRDVPGADSE